MGKIRIKTLGIEEEQELQQKTKEKREQKKLRKLAKLPGSRGGEKIAEVGVSVEEFEKLERKAKKEAVEKAFVPASAEATAGKPCTVLVQGKQEKEEKKEKQVEKKKKIEEKPAGEEKAPPPSRFRSQNYQKAAKLVDRSKLYPIQQAIDLMKQTSYSKFNGSVEVHVNCLEKGIKVTVTLPHGTGKERHVAVCDEKILEKIAAGKIDFDVLVATPEFMPKLAKFAKFLGPKGLMPNPKAGTVTITPEKVVAELKGGRVDLKTESAAPIIHTVIGKVDFEKEKLLENFLKLIEAVGPEKIKSVFIKATMGPSIKVSS